MNEAALHYQSFGLPKRDHGEQEYEDALAAAPEANRFAIADGATDSSYSALWAQLLVEAFVQAPACKPAEWCTWLPPLQERWAAQVDRQSLPWYAEAKVRQGAFATFLGLVVEPMTWLRRNQWRAVAVGDCCLFQIREQALYRGFPIRRSTDFNNRPGLVGSRVPPAALLEKKRVQVRKGRWRHGDQLWLMTDALAKWFLVQHEAGKQPCDVVQRMLAAASAQDFAVWVDELRRTKELRNDDVTLLAIRLHCAADVNPQG